MEKMSRTEKNNKDSSIEETSNRSGTINKKTKKYGKIKTILFALLLFFLIWLIFLFVNLNKSYLSSEAFDQKSIGSDSAVTMVVGVDGLAESELKESSNNNDKDNRHGIRSDSIMLVATNPSKNNIKTISVYRDLLTKNVCAGTYGKINESFTTGWYKKQDEDSKQKVTNGAICLKRSIENYFDIKINNYIVINFSGFERIINAVGGVDVDIIGGQKKGTKFCEQDKNSKNGNPDESSWDKGKYCFKIGDNMHLNGEEALSYARHRHSDDDRWRTMRQNEVLKGIFKSMKNPLNLTMFPFKSSTISEAVTTNISSTNGINYILKHITSLGDIEVQHIDMSFIDDVRGGIYYLNIPRTEKINAEKEFNKFLDN